MTSIIVTGGISWEDPIWTEMLKFRWRRWEIGSFDWKKQRVTFTVIVMISWSVNWPMRVTLWPIWRLKLIKILHIFSYFDMPRVGHNRPSCGYDQNSGWLSFYKQGIFILVDINSPFLFVAAVLCPGDSGDNDLDLGSWKITLFFVITTLAK